ncbi:MAG: [protein-PII] uridylyltransferase [Alphaproteobacteria bacterium]|nr:[protein-PII] uridylyltransferase [Alphaproteobacteria bacterium]
MPFRQRKKDLLLALADQLKSSSVRQVRQGLQRLCKLTDQAIIDLWHDSGLSAPLSLLAVGGYGRGELFPHSDVDVLVLLPNDCQLDLDDDLRQKVESFIGRCWDTGLEIGSSVRTLAECLHESARDITIQTSLLESRPLAGCPQLAAEFHRRYQAAMDPMAFFLSKTLEMNQRHTKFENTPYSLEPNCKESPGGLRDLQILLWVARAAHLGDSWEALARQGMITSHEAKQIKRNEAQLSLIRVRLHLVAGRREDRLVFDLQAQVALMLDMGLNDQGDFNARLGSEQLMRGYYWAAKAVTQLNQIVLLNIEAYLRRDEAVVIDPINERFQQRSGQLDLIDETTYQHHPQAILETFWLLQTTGLSSLSARTLRALYNARGVTDTRFRRDPSNRAMFMRILQEPQGITRAMRLMNQTSVLGRYLWVFRRIVGQMQHDLFHVYTVDQHILMVLRNVRRFFMPEHAHEYPFCSQLAGGWDRPWLLYVAALFHDIAKGRGGDHSQLGRSEARSFCRQHGIGKEDADLIEFLVGEHLTMSHVAQKQDLSDPDVIEQFARKVGHERRLTALYLLTVADIRGTSPKVWNAWKGKLLEDLYRATLRALGGRAPDPDADVESRQREALTELARLALPHQAHRDLWDTLDVSYFMRHEGTDIAWHTRHISRLLADAQHKGQAPGTLVQARMSPWGDGLEVMVYTPDQPDLFARICGYFDHAGFSILDARIHTAKNGYALDTFQLIAPSLTEHYRELITMVESELALTLERAGPLPPPSRGRVSRRVKSFPVTPRVNLQPDEKAQRWLLSVSASDRTGLLYSIAQVLARNRINLKLAKISTLGERVEDTFLIDGPDLQQNRRQIEIETELIAALQG